MTYLIIQLRYNEECPPAPNFLTLDNISKDMISNIEDVLPLGTNEAGEDLAISPAVHNILLVLVTDLIFANVQVARLLVNTPQHSSLVEK